MNIDLNDVRCVVYLNFAVSKNFSYYHFDKDLLYLASFGEIGVADRGRLREGFGPLAASSDEAYLIAFLQS